MADFLAAVILAEVAVAGFNMSRKRFHRKNGSNPSQSFWQVKNDPVKKIREDQIAEGRRMMKAELQELKVLDTNK